MQMNQNSKSLTDQAMQIAPEILLMGIENEQIL